MGLHQGDAWCVQACRISYTIHKNLSEALSFESKRDFFPKGHSNIHDHLFLIRHSFYLWPKILLFSVIVVDAAEVDLAAY